LGLVIAGVIFAPVAYFLIDSIPFTAIGISALMIGFTSLALANSRLFISPEASELMMKAGMENTSALLEEFGLRNKAIYLPSSMLGGRSYAVVPLKNTIELDRIVAKIPGRLIVHYGDNPEDMAVAVTTPGNIRLDGLDIKSGATPTEIESAMTYALVGLLDLANSVAINLADRQMDIVVSGVRLHYEDNWYYRCLGSPIASIVANIVCESLGKPVRIAVETYQRGKEHILLEVLS